MGQISDGMWENTPNTGWERWCDAKVEVDPANVGRNFWVQKDSFGFNRRALLDIVGSRMLAYVRIAKVYGQKNLYDMEALAGAIQVYGISNLPEYYLRKLQIAYTMGIDPNDLVHVAGDERIYSFSEMLVDLRDLMKIIKIWSR